MTRRRAAKRQGTPVQPVQPVRRSERVRRQKEAGAHRAAQEATERAAKIADRKSDGQSDSSSTSHTSEETASTSSDEEEKDTLSGRDLTYGHLRAIGALAATISAQGNIDGSTPRPPREPLIRISPLGEMCVITLFDNGNGTVQDMHVMGRTAAAAVVVGLEIVMGLQPDTLHLDTRLNRVFVEIAIHTAYDRFKCAFFPKIEDLQRLLRALRQQPITSAEGDRLLRRRDEFLHHEKVFPRAVRQFHFVPFSTWSENIPITCRTAVDEQEYRTYRAPFTAGPNNNEEALPIIKMHCSPYFVVWQAYVALSKPGTQAPVYVQHEARVIKKIGHAMRRRMSAPAG